MLGGKASKNPVQDALDLVNKYDRTGGSKFRNSLPSKGDVQHDDRQKNLKDKLIASKQRVVHHLRVSRSIERSIMQTEIVDNAIKAQLGNRVEKDSAGKVADRIKESHRSAGSSISQSWLEGTDLRVIEDVMGLEMGHAGIIQSTLNRYDDSKLCRELSSMPQSSRSKMNLTMFSKVAMLTSKDRISNIEACTMFEFAMKILEKRIIGESDNAYVIDEKWGILSSLLRNQLLKLELATALKNAVPALPGSMSLSTISTATSMTPLNRSGNNKLGPIPAGGGDDVSVMGNSIVSWENDTACKSLASPPKNIHHKKNSSGKLSGSPVPFKEYSNLKGKYDKSQSRQLELSDQIISNLSKISKSVRIDEDHASATEFAKRISVRKFEGVLVKLVTKALKIAFEQWYDVLKFHRYQIEASSSLKSFGVFQLYYFIEKNFNSKLARGMKRLQKRIEWLQDMEQLSAIAELQRYWRGCLCRKRIANRERNYAATQIMRISRGRQGRAYAIKYAEYQKLRVEALRIENAYMKYRWRRIRKNIRVFKIQKSMTETLQRTYRGHCGRKLARRLKNQSVAITSCMKIQNAWRRFRAIMIVDKKTRIRQRYRSATKMQKLVRGIQSRKVTVVLLHRYRMARIIQCMARCFIARKTRKWKYDNRCALNIQRVYRGKLGRKRFAWFLNRHLNFVRMRKEALVVLEPLLLGYRARRKWVPIITDYILKRKNATIAIQCMIRNRTACKRVNKLRDDRDNVELQKRLAEEARLERLRAEFESAGAIQRVIRGFLGRRKAIKRGIEVEQMEALKAARLPAYYRLRDEYYKSQNMFHRPYLIRIQCAYRCMLARMKYKVKKRQISVLKIENQWYSYLAIQSAKIYVAELRELRRLQNIGAVHMQRIIRGFLGRYEAKKHEHAEIFKWFIGEVQKQGLIGRALQNFRVRKRTQDKINRQITYAQALVRKFLTRCKFLRGYKRLVRERDSRRKKRRVRACTSIQGFARIIKAQKVVHKRKHVLAEEAKLKGEQEELDRRIEGIHSDWEQGLLATRIETMARGNLGKAHAEKKVEENKFEKEKQDKALRAKAATQIQSLARGVRRRELLKPLIPGLRAEKQKRSFCVECESNVAVKRCRTCKDRYCDACYLMIHRKGHRKNHSWEPIHQDSRSAGSSTPDVSNKKSKRRAQNEIVNNVQNKNDNQAKSQQGGKIKKVKEKSEWVKYYDEAARAHYWFSDVTGEARWTDPNL